MSGRGEKNRRSPSAHLSYESGYAQAKIETRVAGKVPRIPTKNVVDCPTCKATIGSWCLNAKGGSMLTYHVARRRMAVRKYTEQKENLYEKDV